MIRIVLLFWTGLALAACGGNDDVVESPSVADVESDSSYSDDDYDDYVDEGYEDDSMASDPELGYLEASIDGDQASSRAYCSVLLLGDDSIENSSSVSINFNVHQPFGEDESEWLSGEASVRGAFSIDDDAWRTSAQYSVPVPEGTDSDDIDFWIHDFVNPDSVRYSMQVSGAPFDYRQDLLPESTSDYDDRIYETVIEWRGDAVGKLASGGDRRGMVEMRYTGVCQIDQT